MPICLTIRSLLEGILASTVILIYFLSKNTGLLNLKLLTSSCLKVPIVQSLPEGGYLGEQRVEHGDVPLERRVVGVHLVPHGRHRHVEQALDLWVAADAVSFWKYGIIYS